LRAVRGEPLRRLYGGFAQGLERAALDFVGRGNASDGCERQVPELARLLTTAGDQPLDDNAQSASAANGQ
jgi:hypothetical protein